MNKNIKLKIIVSSIITILPVFFGLVMWNDLPDMLATHFGANGEVTGESSKLFAVLGLPLFLLAVHLMCVFATLADPKRKNISNVLFNVLICVVPACSVFCSAVTYGHAYGISFNVERVLPAAVGVLIGVIGVFLPGCRQNYTTGIKLPWTLADEEVWDKTHAFCSKVWVAGGIVILLCALLKFVYLYVVAVFVICIVPCVYSYLIYRKKYKGGIL